MGKEYLITVIQNGDIIRKREKISQEELLTEVYRYYNDEARRSKFLVRPKLVLESLHFLVYGRGV